jgi:FlaA1/EpsC-like NDP-sugar epimerase
MIRAAVRALTPDSSVSAVPDSRTFASMTLEMRRILAVSVSLIREEKTVTCIRGMARAIYELRGRTVLITGAAGGIGSETARQQVTRGTNVACWMLMTSGWRRSPGTGRRGLVAAGDVTGLPLKPRSI